MSTPEERLKVANEILGNHAWVKTWIQHQGVAALLDALVEAEAAVVSAQDRESEADHRLLDLLECGHCHEIENTHAVGFFCMVDGEVLKTVYTPRVAFDRIVKLEEQLRDAGVLSAEGSKKLAEAIENPPPLPEKMQKLLLENKARVEQAAAASIYDQSVHIASLARNYFLSQSGPDARQALWGMIEAVRRVLYG